VLELALSRSPTPLPDEEEAAAVAGVAKDAPAAEQRAITSTSSDILPH